LDFFRARKRGEVFKQKYFQKSQSFSELNFQKSSNRCKRRNLNNPSATAKFLLKKFYDFHGPLSLELISSLECGSIGIESVDILGPFNECPLLRELLSFVGTKSSSPAHPNAALVESLRARIRALESAAPSDADFDVHWKYECEEAQKKCDALEQKSASSNEMARNRICQLEKQLETASAHLSGVRGDLQKKHERIEALKSEKLSLRKEVSTIKATFDTEKAKSKGLLADHSSALNRAQRRISELEKRLETESARIGAMNDELNKNRRTITKLASLCFSKFSVDFCRFIFTFAVPLFFVEFHF
jgi:hypothetical protein